MSRAQLQHKEQAPDGEWNPWPESDPAAPRPAVPPPAVQAKIAKRQADVRAYIATRPNDAAVKAFLAYYPELKECADSW